MSVSLSRPDERLAHERARYVVRTTELRAAEADAVAYAELGYSASGIATQIDRGESTVRAYLARTIAGYGPEAVHARAPGDFETDRDLAAVDADALVAWPEHYVDAWLDAVASHPERAPEAVDPGVWL